MQLPNFEDFLKEMHGKIYTGTDDDMPDAFDGWLERLQADDFISLGNLAMKESYIAGAAKPMEVLTKINSLL